MIQTDELPTRTIRGRSLTVQIPPGQYRIAVKQIASGRRVRHNRRMAPIRLVITQNSHPPIVDPRHVFLTTAEVMARYQWGRTKGYEVMRTRRDGFPLGIGGRYRLDTLLRWEDEHLGLAPKPATSPETPQLPPRKRPLLHVSKTAFVEDAVRSAARKVIARSDVTLMNPDVFDSMMSALDRPDDSAGLAELAKLPKLIGR